MTSLDMDPIDRGTPGHRKVGLENITNAAYLQVFSVPLYSIRSQHHHVQEGLGLIPVPCILKMKLVPPSLPRSSYVSSSFWFIL